MGSRLDFSTIEYYRGWDCLYYPNGPETGKWAGYRFGVRVSAGTLELLKTIIDNRILCYPDTKGA